MSEGPLKGIKIIDASSILMVPYCTRLLADMGAEIIKIEALEGDNTRYNGPLTLPKKSLKYFVKLLICKINYIIFKIKS